MVVEASLVVEKVLGLKLRSMQGRVGGRAVVA